MELAERIGNDMKEAMRSGEKLRLETIRSLRAAILELEKSGKGATTDEDELKAVMNQAKRRKDAAEQFRAAGREDLAAKEEREATVIQEYLPGAASADDMARAVEAAVAETGASTPKDMGAVMKAARLRLQGQTVDGKALSDLVKSRLSR